MRIAIIGSGNTATVFGRLLTNTGHVISGVYSKTVAHAQQLAVELNAQYHGTVDTIIDEADLYIIAVSDDMIGNIAGALKLPGKIVVHTSGSVPMGVLGKISSDYGILYPLQSLRKQATHQQVIPLLVDGSNDKVKMLVKQLAGSISGIVEEAGDDKRLKLHLAAVIAANFTNHLYALAEDYCTKEGANFKTLVPLIQEIAERTAVYSPVAMQTGPAVRGDRQIIEKHLRLLENHPAQQNIYRVLTDSITTFYENMPK